MAYRFLLEVPESRVDEANIVVGSVADAQVVLVRNSHGLGFDDPFADLTIAAHTLRVIGAIYDWREADASLANLHLVLHSGTRVDLAQFARGEMVAAIRRDQPWVERTLPKIGDHARDVLGTDSDQADIKPAQPVRAQSAERGEIDPIVTASKRLTFISRARVNIKVTELDRAERYYVDFLGTHLLSRDREDDQGILHTVERDYHASRALSAGTEADFSYLANGPLEIALERVGRGARLERSLDGPVRLDVARATFLTLKGEALMRGMEFVVDQPESFAVRDIYGLVWQFHATANVPALI